MGPPRLVATGMRSASVGVSGQLVCGYSGCARISAAVRGVLPDCDGCCAMLNEVCRTRGCAALWQTLAMERADNALVSAWVSRLW